jgi:hypothetical protein
LAVNPAGDAVEVGEAPLRLQGVPQERNVDEPFLLRELGVRGVGADEPGVAAVEEARVQAQRDRREGSRPAALRGEGEVDDIADDGLGILGPGVACRARVGWPCRARTRPVPAPIPSSSVRRSIPRSRSGVPRMVSPLYVLRLWRIGALDPDACLEGRSAVGRWR